MDPIGAHHVDRQLSGGGRVGRVRRNGFYPDARQARQEVTIPVVVSVIREHEPRQVIGIFRSLLLGRGDGRLVEFDIGGQGQAMCPRMRGPRRRAAPHTAHGAPSSTGSDGQVVRPARTAENVEQTPLTTGIASRRNPPIQLLGNWHWHGEPIEEQSFSNEGPLTKVVQYRGGSPEFLRHGPGLPSRRLMPRTSRDRVPPRLSESSSITRCRTATGRPHVALSASVGVSRAARTAG